MPQDSLNIFEKILAPELYRGNIDRYRDRLQACILPGARLPACFTYHPLANGHNEAAIFGDRHELKWRDKPAIWMLPAYERFDAGDGARIQIYFRLVMQHELLAFQGEA